LAELFPTGRPQIATAHLLLSGSMAGAGPSLAEVWEAKRVVAGELPAPVNTGTKATNVSEILEDADGVIVGTVLEVCGSNWNPVDGSRVERLAAAART
jgi:predicted TIM-barrel enzyme